MMDVERLKRQGEDRWLIVEASKGKRVLELGCVNHTIEGIQEQRELGTWLFDYLHTYAAHATGLDIDKQAVDYLAEHGYDVRFGDAQNFDLGEKYDIIVVSKVIDHLANIDGFLRSCMRHLAPGGKVIIADDNVLCLPQLLIWYCKKTVGQPDDDITIKIIPEYFHLFARRYGLGVERIHYMAGTGNSKVLKTFRLISKLTPRFLKYPPLFYPSFVLILRQS